MLVIWLVWILGPVPKNSKTQVRLFPDNRYITTTHYFLCSLEAEVHFLIKQSYLFQTSLSVIFWILSLQAALRNIGFGVLEPTPCCYPSQLYLEFCLVRPGIVLEECP